MVHEGVEIQTHEYLYYCNIQGWIPQVQCGSFTSKQRNSTILIIEQTTVQYGMYLIK